MAKCPQCGKYFDDALSFCLDDGTSLVADGQAASEMPTADYRNSPTLNNPGKTFPNPSVPTLSQSRSTGPATSTILIVVFLVISGFVLLGAAGVAGFMFYAASGVDAENSVTSDPPKRSPTPLDSLGDPIRSSDDPIRKEGDPFPANATDPATPSRDRTNDLANRGPIPKQISGGMLNGKAISLPKPPYPAAARAVRASGSVNIQVLVDETGSVVTASAVSGHPLLRAAATQAARSAKFEPTKLSGQAVKVSGIITYNFVP